MKIASFPFQTMDWSSIAPEVHPGITGKALWKTIMMGDIRIRTVEYTASYLADHWCSKGHIIYCISGEMITELEDGRSYILTQGMTCQVGDNSDPHRSKSLHGCTLFIVD